MDEVERVQSLRAAAAARIAYTGTRIFLSMEYFRSRLHERLQCVNRDALPRYASIGTGFRCVSAWMCIADNTSREVKNNMLLRWAAAQVSSSNVRSITFRFLRQGHSHEDVDQAFGRLSRHLSSKLQRANVPQDFVDSVDGFAKAMYRPHEAGRYTVKLDRCRDWMLFLIHIICICPFSHSLISNHYQCKKDRDGFSSLASLFFSHAGIQKQK